MSRVANEKTQQAEGTTLRDLTPEELLIVSGGASTEGITIVCPYPYPDTFWEDDYWYDYGDPNYEDVYSGGGGGGYTDPAPEPEPDPAPVTPEPGDVPVDDGIVYDPYSGGSAGSGDNPYYNLP